MVGGGLQPGCVHLSVRPPEERPPAPHHAFLPLQESSELKLPARVPERISRLIRACACIDPRQRLRARALVTVLESML